MTALATIMFCRSLGPRVINEWWPRFNLNALPMIGMRFSFENGHPFTYSIREGDERWESTAYPDGHEELSREGVKP